jgi:hypothetical protein
VAMALSWAAERFAFSASGRGRAPEPDPVPEPRPQRLGTAGRPIFATASSANWNRCNDRLNPPGQIAYESARIDRKLNGAPELIGS